MTWRCCLCDAAGENRRGQIRENERIPVCASHRAELRWKGREAPHDAAPIDPVIEQFARQAMLAAAG